MRSARLTASVNDRRSPEADDAAGVGPAHGCTTRLSRRRSCRDQYDDPARARHAGDRDARTPGAASRRHADIAERSDFEAQLYQLLRGYHATLGADRRALFDQYRPVDMARKVVGVGSVGTRSWMILLLGRDDRDALVLQAKEAGPSVLEEHLGDAEQDNRGERVVVGQRLMQTVSDIFLGWLRATGIKAAERDFYIRQLRDWKGSFEVEEMVPRGLRSYADLCGWTLARTHARSGDRIAIAGYLGSSSAFDSALVGFARAYADQNERDHRALLDAIADGRVAAVTGI